MRLHALDSVRGLAAFAVVIYHCLLVYPDYYSILGADGTSIYEAPAAWVAWLTLFPARFLWLGREAVILFFVLSGFVLSLGYLGSRPLAYIPFIAKRVCRLYVPFAVMIVVVAALHSAVGPRGDPALSDWFNASWSEAATPAVLLEHLALIGDMSLNNVSWALAIEWRVSIIFPLLVMAAMFNLPLALSISIVFVGMDELALRQWGFTRLATLSYVVHFLLGISLAVHRDDVRRRLAALSPALIGLCWAIAYGLINARWIFPVSSAVADLANGCGAALLLALVLASPRVSDLLGRQPLLLLGAISYSLYLVHVPVIMTMINLLGDRLPLPVVLSLVPPVSLVVAYGFYRLVEDPSTQAGQRLARRLSARPVEVPV
jgi:peptidoglycan/LPS O-acetylase OafA/YrhL